MKPQNSFFNSSFKNQFDSEKIKVIIGLTSKTTTTKKPYSPFINKDAISYTMYFAITRKVLSQKNPCYKWTETDNTSNVQNDII